MISAKDFKFKQLVFIVTKEGEKLSFKNDNLIIMDKDNKIIYQSTCYRLFAIYIVGNITITSGLIQRARKFGFSIVMMTVNFRPYQTISTTGEANVLLRQKQYAYASIKAAQQLTRNKIINQRSVLIDKRNKTIADKNNIAAMYKILSLIENQKSIAEVMGLEGKAARYYFESCFDNVEWNGRKPRIKPDMTNALLDMGYTQLFCFIESLLAIYGFDLYQGIMHRQFYMRKSLACDMVEPFRIIIDMQVKKGINLEQFKEKDFKVYNGKWCLDYKNFSKYSNIFMKAILDYKNDIFLYIQKFYRTFMKEKLDTDFPMWYIKE